MSTLYEHITRIAADPDKARELSLDVDVQREIVRLRRPAVKLDINGDGVLDGPVYPTLDAENAPFTGTPMVVFSLSAAGEPLRVDGYVQEDLSLEIEGDWSGEVRQAMTEQYAQMLSLIGFDTALTN
jgi:hypothetical protein